MDSAALQAFEWVFSSSVTIFNWWAGLKIFNMFLGLAVVYLILKIFDLFR